MKVNKIKIKIYLYVIYDTVRKYAINIRKSEDPTKFELPEILNLSPRV